MQIYNHERASVSVCKVPTAQTRLIVDYKLSSVVPNLLWCEVDVHLHAYSHLKGNITGGDTKGPGGDGIHESMLSSTAELTYVQINR